LIPSSPVLRCPKRGCGLAAGRTGFRAKGGALFLCRANSIFYGDKLDFMGKNSGG